MKTSPALVAQSKTSQENILPLPWVNRLFERFALMYGNAFLDKWKGVDHDRLKQAWAEDLSGLTAEDLKRGLAACKGSAFPPALPEFIGLCRPALDNECAYLEASEQMRIRHSTGKDVWSTPAIYWSASRIGNDIQTHSYATMKARWVATLDKVNQEISQGLLPNSVPEKREELPSPGKTSIPQDEAKKRIASAVRSIKPVTDYKAWARRILENPKDYPAISIKAAEESLSVSNQQEVAA